MSENFLSRWSRRKLETEPGPEPAAPTGTDETASGPQSPPDVPPAADSDQPVKKAEPDFDLSTLPSIESITSETDIKLFLQKGVPAQLTRAALRRAWSADPAIRDFREMAENQWDFATGSDLPGFGSLDLSAEELRRLVQDVFGDAPKPSDEADTSSDVSEPSKETAKSDRPTLPASTDIATSSEEELPPESAAVDVVQRGEVNVAMQQSSSEPEFEALPLRRSHGGALPQ